MAHLGSEVQVKTSSENFALNFNVRGFWFLKEARGRYEVQRATWGPRVVAFTSLVLLYMCSYMLFMVFISSGVPPCIHVKQDPLKLSVNGSTNFTTIVLALPIVGGIFNNMFSLSIFGIFPSSRDMSFY
jgi:hypothetical protein